MFRMLGHGTQNSRDYSEWDLVTSREKLKEGEGFQGLNVKQQGLKMKFCPTNRVID